mgnify:CR=1 FL=1
MDNDEAVADFLAQRLEKREEERKRLEDRNALTHRANLGFLLVTWRFILLARAALFALAGAALQYTLQNIGSFVNTARFVPVFETLFGRETVMLSIVRLITPAQAAILVAIIILSIAAVILAVDMTLSRLQARCIEIGISSERELGVPGLFSAIRGRPWLIAFPFWIARGAIVLVGASALWYLLINK